MTVMSAESQAAKTQAMVLTIVGFATMVLCCNWIGGLISGILGAVALSKAATDPIGAKKLTMIGWIVFGAVIALGVVFGIIGLATGLFNNSTSSYGN
jgi:4-hydroxybenzoate polyprenyltransferase